MHVIEMSIFTMFKYPYSIIYYDNREFPQPGISILHYEFLFEISDNTCYLKE